MYTDRAMPVFSVGRLEGGGIGTKSAAGMRKALASVIGKAKAVGKQKPEQDRNKLGMEAKEKEGKGEVFFILLTKNKVSGKVYSSKER